MKRELSFYEFVGILTPSVILLYFLNYLIKDSLNITIIEYSELGQSAIFLIIAYGFGHTLHSLGNLL